MMRSDAPRRTRIQLLALAAVLGFALVGLTQCRNVTERVTGIELNTAQSLSARNSCSRRCNREFKAALLAEEQRFIAAKRACGRDYGCRKEQDLIHFRNLQQILRDRVRCKRTCYNEGSGAGA